MNKITSQNVNKGNAHICFDCQTEKYERTPFKSLFRQTNMSLIALLTHRKRHFIPTRHKQNKTHQNSLSFAFHNHVWFGFLKKSSVHRVRCRMLVPDSLSPGAKCLP